MIRMPNISLNPIRVFAICLLLALFAVIPYHQAYSGVNKAPNPPLGWVGCDLGYFTAPNLGSYRDYINGYYANLGSSEKMANFGGRAAINLQFKSFISSHFAYGCFLTMGGFATDQVFRYYDNFSKGYQAREEYRLRTADIGFDFTFTPVNSRSTHFIPYICAGGMLSSGTLEVFYSNYADRNLELMDAISYRENNFNFGYRLAGGILLPVSGRLGLNAVTIFSDSKLDFAIDFDSNAEINMQNRQWFSGVGLIYFYR